MQEMSEKNIKRTLQDKREATEPKAVNKRLKEVEDKLRMEKE